MSPIRGAAAADRSEGRFAEFKAMTTLEEITTA
jgi:hypothetical protein